MSMWSTPAPPLTCIRKNSCTAKSICLSVTRERLPSGSYCTPAAAVRLSRARASPMSIPLRRTSCWKTRPTACVKACVPRAAYERCSFGPRASMRIKALRSERVDGVPVEVFRLKLAGLFGWFLPGSDVYYGTQDHVLMRYVGLSDLRDASGNNLNVDISFNPKDRRPSAKDEVDNALRARLAACT